MNRTWMRERLESFEALCDAYDVEELQAPNRIVNPKLNELFAQISSDVPTVREIIKRLDPELVSLVTAPMSMTGTSSARRAIQEGLGILRDQDEWKANLTPDAPSLIADQFHPHVWEAASAIWDTGQYKVAVGQAAVSLSAHIAAKTRSSLTDRRLVQEVFNPDPPSGNQVRLHFPGDRSSETWRSRQQGLHLIAQGAFAGIRNVAAHVHEEWSEQVALEHLAVLSVVARWTDETKTIRA